MNKQLLLLLFIFAVYPFFSHSQTFEQEARLDSFLDHLSENNKFLGSVAIHDKDGNIYTYSIGLNANGEISKAAVNDSTKYRIGSVTKMFTSVMVHQLIEEGQLTYATPLAEFYPGIPQAGSITIRHLLSHRSGIYNITNAPEYEAYMQRPQTQEAMLKRISDKALDFDPGTQTSYSNSNYILLGYIIEEITGKSYGENLQERIANKTGLRHTAYGDRIEPAKNEVRSYKLGNSWTPATETHMSVPHGAGAIVSTPSDMVKFAAALFDHQLTDAAMLDSMLATNGKMGKGLFPAPFDGKTGYGHTGGIDGFSAVLTYFPEDSVAVAITANGFNYSINEVGIGLLSIFHDQPYDFPDFDYAQLSSEQRSRIPGTYISEYFPLDLVVEDNGGQLTVQATGQSEFPVFPQADTVLINEQVGATFSFGMLKAGQFHELTLEQHGRKFQFTRKDVEEE